MGEGYPNYWGQLLSIKPIKFSNKILLWQTLENLLTGRRHMFIKCTRFCGDGQLA